MSRVKEFSAFLCLGRCRSLGSLESFPWCVPQLSGASILFPSPELPQASLRVWLQSNRDKRRVFFPA